MDRYLLAWARRVKARAPARPQARAALPPLWLFTDNLRLPDPRAAVARLPRHLCGVVFRHDDAPEHAGRRAALGRELARLCRARGTMLAVAGDWRLAAALHAGLHARGGCVPPGTPRRLRRAILTASAHDVREATRARRAGARLAFVSPLFPTASHPGAGGLGPLRWRLIARHAGPIASALGGIAGPRVRAVPRGCAAVGAIDAFAAGPRTTPAPKGRG